MIDVIQAYMNQILAAGGERTPERAAQFAHACMTVAALVFRAYEGSPEQIHALWQQTCEAAWRQTEPGVKSDA